MGIEKVVVRSKRSSRSKERIREENELIIWGIVEYVIKKV